VATPNAAAAAGSQDNGEDEPYAGQLVTRRIRYAAMLRLAHIGVTDDLRLGEGPFGSTVSRRGLTGPTADGHYRCSAAVCTIVECMHWLFLRECPIDFRLCSMKLTLRL